MMKIPITKPCFGPEELEIVQKPLKTGWVVQGPYVRQFEEKFSDFTGAKHSAATTSCTTALHILMAALELGPGDEVIVPAFTWVATANVVEYMRATPIFCDIRLETFTIDIEQIESLITERTVGIIPVHLFGLAADINPILEIADKHALWVVEDAACGFGTYYKGRHVGTSSDAGAFSFHPRKAITTGEGGMITTNQDNLDSLIRSLRNHGASRHDPALHSDKYGFLLGEYDLLGYNFRMTDIQGALGVVQMDRSAWILGERKRVARNYDEALGNIAWLALPIEPEGYVHGYQSYVSLFRPENPSLANVERLHQQRNAVMEALAQKGIATRQGTHAVTLQDYYVKKYSLRWEQFPNAYLADRLSLALPLYPQLTSEEQEEVVRQLIASMG